MPAHPTPIEITHLNNLNDLFHLVEEVNSTKQPRILKRDNETVAMLIPVGTPIKPEKKRANKKAIEDTLALAGSWSDLDWDEMIRELDRIRHQSKPTPPLDLDL